MKRTALQDCVFTFLKKEKLLKNYSRVLDIGIGKGYVSKLIKKEYNCEIYGLDIPTEEIKIQKNNLESYGIKIKFCDITKQKIPLENNKFDIVLFLNVLEHLITSHPPFQILEDIRDKLKLGGHLVITTPNLAALHKRILLLLGKNPSPHGFRHRISYKKHFREYTCGDLSYLLQQTGYKTARFLLKNFYFLASNPIARVCTIYPRFRDTIMLLAKKL